MSDDGCVFCSIVESNRPEHAMVAESDSALAFMDAFPVSLGHVLVVPKAHATDIWSLGADDGKETFDLARQVAVAVRTALRPDGLKSVPGERQGRLADRVPLPHPRRTALVRRSDRPAVDRPEIRIRRGDPGGRASHPRRPRDVIYMGTTSGICTGSVKRIGDDLNPFTMR